MDYNCLGCMGTSTNHTCVKNNSTNSLKIQYSLYDSKLTKILDESINAVDEPYKESQGLRYDSEKPRVDLLSPIAMLGIAKVLEYGAKKYTENNWRKGMAWGRVIASLLRHIFKFMSGEDIDTESGLPHVDHIACNAMFLQEYYQTHKNLDDRYKINKKS